MAWLALFRRVQEVAPWVASLAFGALLLRAALSQQLVEALVAAICGGCLLGCQAAVRSRVKTLDHMAYSTFGGLLGLLVLWLGNFGEAAMVTLPFWLFLHPAIPAGRWHGRGDEAEAPDDVAERGDIPASLYRGRRTSRGLALGVAGTFAVHLIAVGFAEFLDQAWLGWVSLLATAGMLGITSIRTEVGMRDGVETLLERLQQMGRMGGMMGGQEDYRRSWSEIGLGVVVGVSTAVDGWADRVSRFWGRVLLGSPFEAAEDQYLTYWELAVLRFGLGQVALVGIASSAALIGTSLALAAWLGSLWVVLAAGLIVLGAGAILRGFESGWLRQGITVAQEVICGFLELEPATARSVEVGRQDAQSALSDALVEEVSKGLVGEAGASHLVSSISDAAILGVEAEEALPEATVLDREEGQETLAEGACEAGCRTDPECADCESHRWDNYWEQLIAFADASTARRVRLELRDRWLEVEHTTGGDAICLPTFCPEVVLEVPIAMTAGGGEPGRDVGRVELVVREEAASVERVVDELLGCLGRLNAGGAGRGGQLRFGEVTRVDQPEGISPA